MSARQRRRAPGQPVTRFHDPAFKAMVVKVLPGDHYVSRAHEEMLVTVLGSCVSACIRDPIEKVGGMNHFMLPGDVRGGSWGEANNGMRYGQYAMERLINDLLAQGARRDRLEVKLFGGANVLRSRLKIGDNNADFARRYAQAEGLRVAAADLGGTSPRRIHYFPLTGRVMRLELSREPSRQVFQEELTYRHSLDRTELDGSVELFA